MDIALILVMVAVGLVGGLITGALAVLIKVGYADIKARRDYKKGKNTFERIDKR